MKTYKIKLKKLAVFYGVLLGDGCLSKIEPKHYFISIVGHLTEDYPFFHQTLVPILESFTKRPIVVRNRYKQRKLEILFTNKRLFHFLNNIGFPIGKKGVDLMIPSLFNNNSIKYIIQGYFATDGSLILTNNNGVVYPRIEFSGISHKLLLQVLKYLSRIGMKGRLYRSKVYPNNRWHTLYRIQFNGKENLLIFRKKIGFINSKHEKKYKKYKKNAGGDI